MGTEIQSQALSWPISACFALQLHSRQGCQLSVMPIRDTLPFLGLLSMFASPLSTPRLLARGGWSSGSVPAGSYKLRSLEQSI